MNQRTLYRAGGAAAVIIVLAILVMVNWIGARHWVRFDWTSAKIYSISSRTKEVLKGLEEDADIYVIMSDTDSLYEPLKGMLDQYTRYTDKIKLHFHDPMKDSIKIKQLAKELGQRLEEGVVVKVGKRSKNIPRYKLAEFQFGAFGTQNLKKLKAESAITGALVSVTRSEKPVIYFVTGHGEITPKSMGEASIRMLAERLRTEDVELKETTLLSGKVPEDASALAIMGPKSRFADQEIEAIKNYLEHGGSVLVCLDPTIESPSQVSETGLEDLLATWGVRVRNDVVVDLKNSYPGMPFLLLGLPSKEHPVGEAISSLGGMLLPYVRSLELVHSDKWTVKSLLKSSDDAWGETNLANRMVAKDDKDNKPPLILAAAVEGKEENPFKLIVVGDSGFALDSRILTAANLGFAINALHWLAEKEAKLGIPPKDVQPAHLSLTKKQFWVRVVVAVLVLPVLPMLLGIAVYLARRR